MFYLLLTAHAALSIGTNRSQILAVANVQLFRDMGAASGLEIPFTVPLTGERYLSLNPFVRLRDLPELGRCSQRSRRFRSPLIRFRSLILRRTIANSLLEP